MTVKWYQPFRRMKERDKIKTEPRSRLGFRSPAINEVVALLSSCFQSFSEKQTKQSKVELVN